jgi:hypothetical protein
MRAIQQIVMNLSTPNRRIKMVTMAGGIVEYACSLLVASQTLGGSVCVCPAVRQFPNGVADADARVAYVADASGGVTAVALDSGRALWQTRQAALPVGLVEGKVVALRRAQDPRESQVIVLDRRNGAVTLTGQPVRTGRGAFADRMLAATLFSVGDGGDGLIVQWRDVAPDVGEAQRDIGPTTRAGGIRVLRDGRVQELPATEQTRDLTAAAAPSYQRGSESTSGPWSVGDCSRGLTVEHGGDDVLRLMLRGIDKELMRARSIAATVSIEGCSVFVETTSADGQPLWTAFSSGTGERLGTVRREPGAWNPTVISGTAYYLVDVIENEPRTLLRAVDLGTGAKRWELPVRARSSKKRMF